MVAEWYTKLVEEHGPAVALDEKNHVFEDGARVHVSDGYFHLTKAPENPYLNYQARRFYLECKLKKAEQHFWDLKQRLLDSTQYEDGGDEILNEAKLDVLRLRTKIRNLERAYAKTEYAQRQAADSARRKGTEGQRELRKMKIKAVTLGNDQFDEATEATDEELDDLMTQLLANSLTFI